MIKAVRFKDRTAHPRSFRVGVEADIGVEQVVFKLPQIAEGQVEKIYWTCGERQDVEVLEDGVWTIGAATTNYPGEHICYIEITVSGVAQWHSEPFVAEVGDLPGIAEDVATAFAEQIQSALDAAEDAEDAAEDAQEALATLLEQTYQIFVNEDNDLVILGPEPEEEET